jgi:hypothetical protein
MARVRMERMATETRISVRVKAAVGLWLGFVVNGEV